MFKDFESLGGGGANQTPVVHLVSGEKRPSSAEECEGRSIGSLVWNEQDLQVQIPTIRAGTACWVCLLYAGAMYVVPTSFPLIVTSGQFVNVDLRRTDRR